jgi:hypothetical protein
MVLIAVLLVRNIGVRNSTSVDTSPAASAPSDTASAKSVTLVVQSNSGYEPESNTVRWRPGMTIGDLMNADPRTSLQSQGSGASAFITSINGVANEGAGGRNWMYSVNGKRGDKSYALFELQPGDHVLWSFEPPQ